MRTLKAMQKAQERFIERHMPAKGAPVLDEDERTDLERFIEEYDRATIDEQDTSRHVEDDGFHPSVLGIYAGGCMRRAVYLLRGVAKVPRFDARTLRVFANGHSVHDRIQRTLKAAGLLAEAEVKIEWEDPPVRGHADGIVILPWNGRRILLEIKSCNETTFTNRRKWKKAKDEHFDQANLYAYILNIDTIWVVYENKDNQQTAIFEHKANPKKAEKILKKWRSAYEIFQNGEIPVRPYKPDSQACMSCDLREHCLADSEVGVSLNGRSNSEESSSV